MNNIEILIQLEALITERDAMIAENDRRRYDGKALAYDDTSFMTLADRINSLRPQNCRGNNKYYAPYSWDDIEPLIKNTPDKYNWWIKDIKDGLWLAFIDYPYEENGKIRSDLMSHGHVVSFGCKLPKINKNLPWYHSRLSRRQAMEKKEYAMNPELLDPDFIVLDEESDEPEVDHTEDCWYTLLNIINVEVYNIWSPVFANGCIAEIFDNDKWISSKDIPPWINKQVRIPSDCITEDGMPTGRALVGIKAKVFNWDSSRDSIVIKRIEGFNEEPHYKNAYRVGKNLFYAEAVYVDPDDAKEYLELKDKLQKL